jgi:hypothetical protein
MGAVLLSTLRHDSVDCAFRACKTARGLQQQKTQRSPNLKRQREFLDSYLGFVPRTVRRFRAVCCGRREPQLPRLRPLLPPGGFRLGAKLPDGRGMSVVVNRVSVGARNSKFHSPDE